LGRIQEAKGLYFEARRSYRMATSLAPDTLPYLYLVGRMEQRMGNWSEAERVYRQLHRSKYKTTEIEKRLAVIEKARKSEKNQALWKTWVEEKPAPVENEEDQAE
jgi:tetratricopeptide (TPR) repeat protein